MIGKEDYAVIKSLDQRGIYLKDIAAELGVRPKTVRRALKRGSAPGRERKKRSSKLDAYKARVDEWLSKGVWDTVVILREIQAEGYEGSGTILREYVTPKCQGRGRPRCGSRRSQASSCRATGGR